MGNTTEHSTWVEIDLSAITNNVQFIGQHTGVEVMAIVKANAYGHGAIPVAQAAIKGGASWLGVARIEEAMELRNASLSIPILLLGYTPPAKLDVAIKNDISFTIWTMEQIKLASIVASQMEKPALIHLKVDTGMSRIGTHKDQVKNLLDVIGNSPDIKLQAIFTHYACADEPDKKTTEEQEKIFQTTISQIQELIKDKILVHAANSATSLTRPSSFFDMVRFGIAMYGLHPSKTCLLPKDFKPALSWKTVLSHVKELPPGRGISYGHEYFTQSDEIIGTLPLGYEDGFRRIAGNYVLVKGKKVPVVGRVCMDQCMVLLNDVPKSKIGDEVVIIGEQANQKISAEDVAEIWNTINYEVVCGISQRVPRVYNE